MAETKSTGLIASQLQKGLKPNPPQREERKSRKRKYQFPGFKILDGYIIRKFLGTYFFSIGLIIVIAVVFDCVEKIDDFIELHAPLSKIITQYYLNFIPFFINQFSCLFTFIAVIFFTSKMAYQTEIIAILSGGTSFNRFMWPYFLSATAITILALALNLFVIPVANQGRIAFESQYFKNKQNARYDEHIYRQAYPGTFVYIRSYSGVNERASYLALERFEGSVMVSSLEAADVAFDPETRHWTAPKYITRTFDGEDETFETHERLDTLINIDAAELGRVEELIKTMNILTLNRFIVQQKTKGSDQIGLFEVERQSRFTYPLSTFILTLIGVSLSSRKVRGGTGLHIMIAFALGFSFILFGKFFEEFAKSGTLPIILAVWIPNIIYALIAVYLYRKAPK